MIEIGATLQSLQSTTNPDSVSFQGLSDSDQDQIKRHSWSHYGGKVRELIMTSKQVFILHTDRLTAFDRYIGMVPFKGLILSEMTGHWMRLCQEVVPTAFQKRLDERCLIAERCEPIKAEVIVRGYLAGSMDRAYSAGERDFCGVRLGEGLRSFGELPEPILTPTSKAAAFEHDENTSPEELIRDEIVTQTEWQQIEKMALNLYRLGREIYSQSGWILVDTKYEFGRNARGELVLIDEAHTPDSSRLWLASSYQERLQSGGIPQMLDKEIVRRYLLELGFQGHGEVPQVPTNQLIDLAMTYLGVAEALLGQKLKAPDSGRYNVHRMIEQIAAQR